MADFVAVIRRAVDGLADNSPENRERVYEKARGAVRRQLENMSPRPSEELMRRQLDKLETAIDEVELEHTEALPPVQESGPETPPAEADVAEAAAVWPEDPDAPDDEPEAEPEELHQPVISPIPRATPRPFTEAAASPDEPTVQETVGDEPGAVSEHSAGAADEPSDGIDPTSLKRRENGSAESAAGAAAAAPFTDSPLIGDAHDEAFGIGNRPAGNNRRRRHIATAAIGLIVLLLIGGAAYGLWINREAFGPMIASLMPSSSSEKPAEPTKNENAAAKPDTESEQAAVEPDASKPAESDKPAEGEKFTQRLMPDGSETNPGPAPAPDQPQAEGKSVTEQLAGSEKDAAAPAETKPATSSPQATAAAESPAISQKMYLYEERFNDQAPAAITGTVVWTLAKESPGGDALPEPAIHGEISVPEKGITALVTIKRNADPSLPASHLIEIVFALPGDFSGGGIGSVQRVSMKQTEQDRGDPLIAVPAKITDDFFMVALNDYPQAVTTNLDLLKSRNWIDIPITYANGRRALITLEKGSSGSEVFGEALKAWTAKAAEVEQPDTTPAGNDDAGSTPPPSNPGTAAGQ